MELITQEERKSDTVISRDSVEFKLSIRMLTSNVVLLLTLIKAEKTCEEKTLRT